MVFAPEQVSSVFAELKVMEFARIKEAVVKRTMDQSRYVQGQKDRKDVSNLLEVVDTEDDLAAGALDMCILWFACRQAVTADRCTVGRDSSGVREQLATRTEEPATVQVVDLVMAEDLVEAEDVAVVLVVAVAV